jgi:hypothetical protein
VVEYLSIQDDYAAYLERLHAGHDGTDAELMGILDALAFIETDDLGRYGLERAYPVKPPGVGGKPPFLVHLPTGADFTPVSTLDDGYAGIEMQVSWKVDLFLAGGHSRVPYSVAMLAAFSLFLPVCMLLLKNSTVGRTCRGVVLTGVDPQALPVPGDNSDIPAVTWLGIAIHAEFVTYYDWRAT